MKTAAAIFPGWPAGRPGPIPSNEDGRASRPRKAIGALLPLVLAAPLALGLGCGKHEEHRSASLESLPVAKVRVASAENKRQTISEEVMGTVRSKTRATLEAKISGRIQDLPVYLGQPVTKGDLVARLDAGEIKARLQQAQASLEQAEKDWLRIASLYKGGAVTRSEYDRAEAQQRLTTASVAEAEATLRHAEVLAPFNGVVSRKWLEVGDLASPGKALVEIEDISVLELEADVPESLASKAQLGAMLTVRLDGLARELDGKIAEIAPSADSASRTVRIKVALAPAPGLIPGRFVRLLLPIGESDLVEVPASALVQRGQLEMVFVVTNHHAQLHLVKSGKTSGDRVNILSGLNPGELVVVEGAGLLRDGQPVEER